jgi:hypothetical protein
MDRCSSSTRKPRLRRRIRRSFDQVSEANWLSRGKGRRRPNSVFRVVTGDPTVALEACDRRVWHRDSAAVDFWTDYLWCALFTGPARPTPIVRVLLDFPAEYIGTDPRLEQGRAKGYFTDRLLAPTSGP